MYSVRSLQLFRGLDSSSIVGRHHWHLDGESHLVCPCNGLAGRIRACAPVQDRSQVSNSYQVVAMITKSGAVFALSLFVWIMLVCPNCVDQMSANGPTVIAVGMTLHKTSENTFTLPTVQISALLGSPSRLIVGERVDLRNGG
ncbi:hypothetical protein NEOLEDRAFT_290804 [Neolentinus lepideus HHB14362 ss-1]|uniref:Uncharacterized protein n=1 Tax=Neolentinus lepideus HHB14362 ss-1 TaxID=1314782 RepID=A0A165SZW3_9AGAM|nr:hypothetical protein NEOLEDRAFT_290804 [Neolentinus lepideus HHB14362 ss-1]